jgi:GPH family glycoside/pentoside/hexuronide:cation symporter
MSNDTSVDAGPEQVGYDDHVPIKAKVGFGFVNAGNAIMSAIGLGTIDVYYIKVYGANPSLLAWSWIAFIVWNMLNDPLLGIIQDRTKTRWGRRIPYLRFGALPYTLSFILVWFPFMQGDIGLFLNHLLMLFVLDTFYSMIGLIGFGLPAEMAITAKERTKVSIFGVAFGASGILFRFIMEPLFLAGDHPNQLIFQIIVTIAGIISGLLIFASSYYIKENLYTQREEAFGFLKSITETFRNKPFLIIEVVIFFTVIMSETLFNGFIYLIDYVLVFTGLSIIFLVIGLVILAVLLIWIMRKIDLWGLKKVLIIGGLIAMVGFIWVFFVGLASNSKVRFEIGGFGIILLGFGLLLFMFYQAPLVGEAIDYDEIRTGKRRESTYAGVNALITKPAVSIAHASILGFMALFGFQQGLEVSAQPASVATGVLIAMTLVPAACLIIVVIALRFNPLEGEAWQAQKHHIQVVHMNKERAYLDSLQQTAD